MAKNLFWISAILLIVLLTGCSQALAPTATLSPTANLAPTTTLKPTATQEPTSTPTPTNTPRPTNTPGPTSTPRPLPTSPNVTFALNRYPGLSGKIIFDVFYGPGDYSRPKAMYVVNADGSKVMHTPYTWDDHSCYSWSIDGKQVVYSSIGKIFVTNAGSSEETWLRVNGFCPIWSQDDKKIAYENETGIFVMNADGTELTQVNSKGCCPVWSPDGRKIAYLGERFSTRKISGGGLFVMNADGTEQTRLTDSTDIVSISWSPDSRKISYLLWKDVNCSIEGEYEYCGLETTGYVINADGSEQSQIHVDEGMQFFQLTWSPDDRRIGLLTGSIIYIMNADGSEQTRLTYCNLGGFAWSPDGKMIVFAAGHGQYNNKIGIIDIDGTNQIILVEASGSNPDIGNFVWVP